MHRANEVEREARRRFVIGDRRSWWLSLSGASEQYDSSTTDLNDVMPASSGPCWFIPETGEVNLPVFLIDASTVRVILGECPFFEYYVGSPTFEWMVAESDHNVFFLCRAR